jgi:hypothetical protein
MADASPAPSWFQRLRITTGPAEPDWADYGTAFGLDRSLDSPVPVDAASNAVPGAAREDGGAEPAAARSRAWWGGLKPARGGR